MQQKFPSARAMANSQATLAVEYRSRNGSHFFEISPALAGTCVAILSLVAALAVAASLYVFAKDDVLRSVLAGQARMQYAYEDRIAQLRAHIDRIAGRQLAEQDTVEAKLAELINRQVQLESRQVLVARLADEAGKAGLVADVPAAKTDRTVTGSVPTLALPRPAAAMPLMTAPQRAKPMPEDSPLRTTSSDPAQPAPTLPQRMGAFDRHMMPVVIDRAQSAANTLSLRQIAAVRTIETKAEDAMRRHRATLTGTGLDLGRFAKVMPKARDADSAVGGPLIPVSRADAAAFEKSLAAARAHIADSQRLGRVIEGLPVRRPLPRHHETTSPFGTRHDPFTRGLALHAGLDFRAPTGTPVRASGQGKVVEAGWVGGYGKMVEIDHGFGLTTRFGHLSSIDVEVGDTVQNGDIVGLVGSTGRSTGPHLHYEVRIDDEAVDPLTFLRAGERAGLH